MKTIFRTMFIAGAIFMVMGCGNNGSTQQPQAEMVAEELPIVAVQQVNARDVLQTVTYPSTVQAFVRNNIAPQMSGRITKINAEIGDFVKKGDVILRIEASYPTLLKGERTSLNIFQRMCGIATETSRYVKELVGTSTQLLDTRKTAPGLRVLDKMAVKHGGGTNHRMGLYDMAMIKDNHIKMAGGITKAVEQVRANIPSTIKVEVETTNLAEVDEAIAAGADIIMLDNMDNATMAKAVEVIKASGKEIKTEASGNMSIPRLKEVAATGVDFISVGALTHTVKAMDRSMNIQVVK